MSLENVATITDIVDAVKALNEKISALEAELSACRSEVSRLNRVNTRVVSENTQLKKLVKELEAEIEILGGKRVEKDSTNSSVPPTQQSIAAQAALRTRSLREPTGRKSGGQEGHEGHELAKSDCPAYTEEHIATTCPHCGAVIPEDAERECTMTTQMVEIGGVMEAPIVTEHRRLTAVCSHCRGRAHGKMPTGKSTKTSYGPKTQTLVVYLNLDVLTHQFCLVHLIRNLQYLNDINEEQQWSRNMQQLFRDAIHERNKAEKPPGKETRKRYEKRLDELLNQDVGHYGKDFQTLQNGIIKCSDFLFTFLDHEGVPHHKGGNRDVDNIVEGTMPARPPSEY